MNSPAIRNQSAAASNRRLVLAADVAKACGLSVHQLDNHFRPDDWASPRDFTYNRTALLFEASSLYRMADTLQACHQIDAAIRLREYLSKLPEPAPRPEELPLKHVEHVDAGPDELDRIVAETGGGRKRHSSDREQLPTNWARDWEGNHE